MLQIDIWVLFQITYRKFEFLLIMRVEAVL